MTSMNSAIHFPLDAEAKVLFRAKGAAAITTTAASNVITLDQLVSTWDAGVVPKGQFALCIFVENAVVDDADETYVFSVQTDNAATFGAPVTHLTTPSYSERGLYVLVVDVTTLRKIDADASHLRLLATLAGTTPSLVYEAWAVPLT